MVDVTYLHAERVLRSFSPAQLKAVSSPVRSTRHWEPNNPEPFDTYYPDQGVELAFRMQRNKLGARLILLETGDIARIQERRSPADGKTTRQDITTSLHYRSGPRAVQGVECPPGLSDAIRSFFCDLGVGGEDHLAKVVIHRWLMALDAKEKECWPNVSVITSIRTATSLKLLDLIGLTIVRADT